LIPIVSAIVRPATLFGRRLTRRVSDVFHEETAHVVE